MHAWVIQALVGYNVDCKYIKYNNESFLHEFYSARRLTVTIDNKVYYRKKLPGSATKCEAQVSIIHKLRLYN